ncbi:MAG: hypothetical protein VYE72_04735 [Candidatus Thermoplasmatota archaeon]|nr:hypothetical protein [Candidatus Thermoplasmatota archaeon]
MSTDGRGLDHLMEQNDTELDFLSAYGGVDDGQQSDGGALLAALQRCLKAGGLDAVVDEATLVFDGGRAVAEPSGCRLTFTGKHLPLVASDVKGPGFAEGTITVDRGEVSVLLTAWSVDQRRFVERLVEHRLHG